MKKPILILALPFFVACGGADPVDDMSMMTQTSEDTLCEVEISSADIDCNICARSWCCEDVAEFERVTDSHQQGVATREDVLYASMDLQECLAASCNYPSCDTFRESLDGDISDLIGNTCPDAYDGECGYSTGRCPAWTDEYDCVTLAALQEQAADDTANGTGDTCVYANDGECDEGLFGFYLCADGTDTTDCFVPEPAPVDDTCVYANDGECDEGLFGFYLCADGTDTTDCSL